MEHWLPLYYETLETLFDYLGEFRILTDHTIREAAGERFTLISDYYDARLDTGKQTKGMGQGAPYKPVPPDQLYLSASR
jgi:transcription-repair coupling factor (superfamily II helicase)